MAHRSTVYSMTMNYIDVLPVGAKFHPREISDSITFLTGGMRRPLSGSIGRYIRYRKEERHDVRLSNRAKSEYEKIEPVDAPDTEDDDITPQDATDKACASLERALAHDGYALKADTITKINEMILNDIEGTEDNDGNV